MKDKKFSWRTLIHIIFKILSWVLFVILLLIAIFLLYYYIANKIYVKKGTGYEPMFSIYTIATPSMVPNINVADAVINIKVNDPNDLKVGDVITFRSSSPTSVGLTITHRIKAITEDEILKRRKFDIRETEALFRYSGGDARKLLNIIDLISSTFGGNETVVIDNATVVSRLNENISVYDKGGEMHYDIISAFIKSVRGSDPNAAVYWMARMLNGGEDPLFIARRMCILAAEDIGLANPNALLLANACFQTVHNIGMPEARIPLSETAIYLASSPKSNSAYMAIGKAMETARQTQDAPVPLYLRNAPTKLMEELGYSDGYKYAHDYPGHWTDLEFMPDTLSGTVFYEPGENRREDEARSRLSGMWPKYYKKGK